MAITFPRDLPYEPTERSPFMPAYQQTVSLTGGGSVNAADVGPMMWRCEFAANMGDRDRFETWVAWLNSLRGSIRTFRGRPPGRRYPLAYPKGFAGVLYLGSQWSGSGNLAVIGASRDTVTINQLPNGLVLRPGDWFSFAGPTRQHLHRIIEGGTSSGSAISLTVEPTIRPDITTTRSVRLDTPYCDMVLESDFTATRNGLGGSISFSGIQVLI